MIVYLLSRVLGVSTWAAIAVLLISLLVLILVVPLFFRSSAPMFMRYGDKRIKLIKEILEGITLIKVRGWEAIFLQKLEVVRQAQLGYLKIFNIGVTGFVVVGQLSATLVPMATLSLFGAEMGTVTAARIFPAISLFTMLAEPLISLPQLLRCVRFSQLLCLSIFDYVWCFTAPSLLLRPLGNEFTTSWSLTNFLLFQMLPNPSPLIPFLLKTDLSGGFPKGILQILRSRNPSCTISTCRSRRVA
jgi:hypothetical protein